MIKKVINTTRLMLKTVEGIYRDGQIEFTEIPDLEDLV
jgi:hypothetical protein